jgi:hypothetical protein
MLAKEMVLYGDVIAGRSHTTEIGERKSAVDFFKDGRWRFG